MQFLTDFLPLLLFLGGYLYSDIYFAIKVLMVAMVVGLILKTIVFRTVDKIYLGSTVALLVLGTATLAFRNPLFLYWKPTVFNWALGGIFLISQWIGDKTIAERLLGKVGQLPPEKWRTLNLAWAVFFVFVGALNIYVAYNYSEDFWVKFKVLGLTAITFVFAIGQAIWMARHMQESEPSEEQVEAE